MNGATAVCGLVATTTKGLTVDAGASVPLLGVKVRARGTCAACRVAVTQRYRNDEEGPIEAVYVFPLESGAAVCGF